MTIYTIYKATNIVNGKVYIGFDSSWPKRKTSHKNSAKYKKTYFQKALLKYGWENFNWEVIYQAKESAKSIQESHTLSVMEPHFISEYRSYIGFDDCNGYNMTSGGQGVSHNKKILEKKRNTYISKYGVDNPQKCPKIKEKTKQTNLLIYNVEHPLQSHEILERTKQTKLEKYGDENFNNRKKAKETWLENYGVTNPSQAEDIKTKKEKTCFKNFGVSNPAQSIIVKDKYKNTCLEKYGTTSSLFIETECPFCKGIVPVFHINQCKLNPDRNVYDRSGSKNPRAIKIQLNGIKFGTIKEASKYTKLTEKKIRDYLKGVNKNLPKGIWELFYL